jgi:phytoene dehydrogenase-like protein
MLYPDEFTSIQATDGKTFTLYTDIDRLEQHMHALAPADARAIDEYIRAARRFTRFEFFGILTGGTWGMIRMAPYMPAMFKAMRVTLEQYAQRFSDPFLRRAFPMMQYDFANIPLGLHLGFLAACHNHTMGWPQGGSLPFAQAIARRYQELGGEIHYKARVDKVLVENDRAVGIRLADSADAQAGAEYRADVVISNADGRTTIYDMLDGRYTDERINNYYANPPDRQEMGLNIYLGVARDLSHEPRAITYLLDQPVTIANETHDRLDIELFSFDPSMAPAGKSPLKVTMPGSYAYWQALAATSKDRYNEEKQRVAETVIDAIEPRFPGLRGQIEAVDVTTPLTTERYTGSFQGLQAWSPSGAGFTAMLKGLSKTLPGLDSFYMVGQWAGATIGIPLVAAMGRSLIQNLCKRDGRRFVASVG